MSRTGPRSLPAFLYGLALLNTGIAIFLTETTGLSLAATFSVAIFCTGTGGLAAIAARASSRSHPGKA